MENELSRLLQVVKIPAFLASSRAELLHLNEEMWALVGGRYEERQRTLIGLGIFENQAEFRGFLRGFSTVGPVQRVRLPSTRLREQAREVWLNATYLKGSDLIFGAITITELGSLPNVAKEKEGFSLLDQLPAMTIMTDGAGKVIYLNHAAQRYLPAEEAGGEALPLVMAKIDAEFTPQMWRQNLVEARKQGCVEYLTHFIRRDGKLLPVNVVICEVEGFPIRSVLLVATDISKERQLEQQLRTAELQLADMEHILERDKEFLKDQIKRSVELETAMSQNSTYIRIINKVKMVAPTDSTVLITGETGTGKELVARAIHVGSRRAREPFVVVNCGALPRELIESELFGYRKGAFTGAIRNQTGRFELADGGTLFLDEIGEMPLDLQTRLLRFLQEGEFTPVGGSAPVYVNVRIIAATNRNLNDMVRCGEFRSDLYFRLNVFPIHNPPLRERREDIPVLIDHFIHKHGRRLNAQVKKVAPSTLKQLMNYPFYGNIRELENIVERALITSEGDMLYLDWDIMPRSERNGAATIDYTTAEKESTFPTNLTLDEMQRRYIEEILRITDGKVSGKGGAAEILDLNPQTLFSKIKKLGVKR